MVKLDTNNWIAIICALMGMVATITAAFLSSSTIVISHGFPNDSTDLRIKSGATKPFATLGSSAPAEISFDQVDSIAIGKKLIYFSLKEILARTDGYKFMLFIGGRPAFSVPISQIREIEFHRVTLLGTQYLYIESVNGVNDFGIEVDPYDKFAFFTFCESKLQPVNNKITITDTKSFYDAFGAGYVLIITFWTLVVLTLFFIAYTIREKMKLNNYVTGGKRR